jgi:hypothetical protein
MGEMGNPYKPLVDTENMKLLLLKPVAVETVKYLGVVGASE